MNRKLNQKGFSLLIVVVVLVVLLALGGVGYYIWQSNNETTTTKQPSSNGPETNSEPEEVTPSKTYKNEDVRLEFNYPSDWKVTNDFRREQLGVTGVIWVTSPTGLVLTIQPNNGGKGAMCEEQPGDEPHSTSVCQTKEYLSKERIKAKINLKSFNSNDHSEDIYLVRVRYTRERKGGVPPPSNYSLQLTNSKVEINQPYIGAVIDRGMVFTSERPAYYDTSMSGIDFSSPEVFERDDMKQAADILRSFSIL